MSNKSGQLSQWDLIWRKQNVMRFSIFWTVLSLAIFLLFGTSMEGTGRPEWYRAVTAYPIQNVPVIFASMLCLRNGLSRRMPSGSKVWLLMGLALFSYFMGNMFFSSWELVWQLSSTGSLGDFFFVLFYILLAAAMLIAVTSRRNNLNIYQWLIVVIVGMYATALATLIQAPSAAMAESPTPLVQEVATEQSSTPPVAPSVVVPEEPPVDLPAWVQACDQFFKPYGKSLNMFYVWCDVGLSCLAMIMLFRFWGGRLSKAWQVNAQALLCIYVADMWYAYAGNQIANYQSGFFLEVFWLIGCLQFGLAAAMEFDAVLLRQRQASAA